jgi:hypothetical protein
MFHEKDLMVQDGDRVIANGSVQTIHSWNHSPANDYGGVSENNPI